MEVIKCPICGNENCKEITEEKYVCLACDNVFLIHNLSKEFKETDKHIDRVYNDLKETITNNSSSADSLDAVYRSGIALLGHDEDDKAQELFVDISIKYAWSYKGWYGQFLVAKKNEKDFCADIYSFIDKVLASEDVTSEAKQTIKEYFKAEREQYLQYISLFMSRYEEFKKKKEDMMNKLVEESADLNVRYTFREKVSNIEAVVYIIFTLCILRFLFGWIFSSYSIIWRVVKIIVLIPLVGVGADFAVLVIPTIIRGISNLVSSKIFHINTKNIEEEWKENYIPKEVIDEAKHEIEELHERLENLKNLCEKTEVFDAAFCRETLDMLYELEQQEKNIVNSLNIEKMKKQISKNDLDEIQSRA